MPFYLVVSLVALALGLLMTYVCRELALRWKFVDQPDNYRKVHLKAIPLSGGYAIFLTVLIVLAGFFFFGDTKVDFIGTYSWQLTILLLGAVLILAMGGADDLYDLRPRYKLLVQLIVATLCYFGGFKIDLVSIPFQGSVDISHLSYPVTVFWYLGCINAINLLDGLDGLAAGIGLFVTITLLINAIINKNEFAIIINAAMVGGILAFLVYNFNPASIFLGDAGSLFIGFMVASMSLLSRNKAETALTLAIPFIAIGLPVFDTAIAILRRWSRRVPMSSADRMHVHHRLLNLGLSQRKVVLILYSVCLLLGGISLLLTLGRESLAMILFGGLLFLTYICSRLAGMIDLKLMSNRYKEDRKDKKRSSNAAVEVEKASQLFEKAKSINEVWEWAMPALEALEMDHACLELDMKNHQEKLIWKSSLYEEHHKAAEKRIVDEWSLFLKLFSENEVFGKFEVWKISEEMPIKNVCFQINKLRNALSDNIKRIEKDKI